MKNILNRFDWVSDFKNGYVNVIKNGKYNIINKEGKLLLNIWFDRIYCYSNKNYKNYIVYLNGKWNIINILNNKYMFKIWLDYISPNNYIHPNFDSYIIVINDEKYLLNLNGNIIHCIDRSNIIYHKYF